MSKHGNSQSDKDKIQKGMKSLNRDQKQELNVYEQSLINYLIQRKEAMNNVPGGLQRLRGLTITINNRDSENPLYVVELAMFQVSFSILTGAKDRGTLFGLERYIMDWYRQMDIAKKLEEIARSMGKQDN